MQKVTYVAQTEANSRLKIETTVPANVSKMIAWILMSNEKDIQPMIQAFNAVNDQQQVKHNA